MRPTLSRFLITVEVIGLIAKKYNHSLDKALHIFYTSEANKLLSDNKTGLYEKSVDYIFSLFEQEMNSKKD